MSFGRKSYSTIHHFSKHGKHASPTQTPPNGHHPAELRSGHAPFSTHSHLDSQVQVISHSPSQLHCIHMSQITQSHTHLIHSLYITCTPFTPCLVSHYTDYFPVPEFLTSDEYCHSSHSSLSLCLS